MNYLIDIQNVSDKRLPLTRVEIRNIAALTLQDHKTRAELTLRIVQPEEMQALNHQYRQQNKTTNVLAFPSALPESIELSHPFLGDIIICSEVMRQESKQLHKTLKAHWSLIVIHGILHLLGYDHINSTDARVMQALEIQVLAKLGYSNPYDDIEDNKVD